MPGRKAWAKIFRRSPKQKPHPEHWQNYVEETLRSRSQEGCPCNIVTCLWV